MPTFSEKVRQRMEERRLSQQALAEAVGTSQSQVSSWLNQGAIPSTPFALKVARTLQLPLEYLVDDAMDVPQAALSETEQLILETVKGVGASYVLRSLLGIYESGVSHNSTRQSWKSTKFRSLQEMIRRYRRARDGCQTAETRAVAVARGIDILDAEIKEREHALKDMQSRLSAMRRDRAELQDQRDRLRSMATESMEEAEHLGLALRHRGIDPDAVSDEELSQAIEADTPYLTLRPESPTPQLATSQPPPLARLPMVRPPKSQKASSDRLADKPSGDKK